MMTESNKTQLLLSDYPLDSLEIGDAFGNKIYADTLTDIIATNDSSKGYAIGLFGSWGVGKTSIIRHLRNSNTDPSLEIIELDAWQYSAQHFRREFLLTITTEEYHKDIRDRLKYKSKKVSGGPPKINYKRLLKGLVIVLGAGFLGYYLPDLLNIIFSIEESSEPTWLKNTLGVLLPVVTAIYVAGIHSIKGILSNVETTIEKDIPIYPDEFRALFKEILEEKPFMNKKKVVFIIDNLDRAAHEIVIEILNSIKTFLLEERCVFVIPCDHQGLVNHIAASRSQDSSGGVVQDKSSANEYLRKYFYTSIEIRPFIPDDLTSFVDNKLAQLDMFVLGSSIHKVPITDETIEKNKAEVSTTVRIGSRLNPRKIIHLLNRLAGEYVLLQNIAGTDPLLAKRLSENLGSLLKMSIIQEEWPDFYRLITSFPEILEQCNRYIRTGDNEDKIRAYSYMGQQQDNAKYGPLDDDNLIEFLRGTLLIEYEDIREIVFFKQSVIDREIEDARSLGRLARNARFETVQDKFDGATAEQRILMASHLVDELKTYNKKYQFTDAGNIARTILKLFPKFMSDLPISSRIADSVGTVLASKEHSKISQAFRVNEFLTVAKYCSNIRKCEEAVNYSIGNWEQLFDKEHSNYEDYSSEAIQYLQFHSVLNNDQASRVHNSIISNIENDDFVTSFQLEVCKQSNDLFNQLPEGFTDKSIQRLVAVASPTFDSDLAYLKWAVPRLSAKIQQQLVKTVADSISEVSPEGNISDQLNRLVQIVALLSPESFSLDPVFEALAPHINAIADPGQKISLLSHFLQAIQFVGVSVLNLYAPLINQVASSALSDILQQILESLAHYHGAGVDTENVLDIISGRLVNDPSLRADNDLIRKYVEVCKKVNDEYVHNLIRDVWETGEITGIFPVVMDVLNVTQGRKMLESVFDKTFEIGDAVLMEQRIDLIKDHFNILKETHINRFREKLLNQWYASPEPSKRSGALRMWGYLLPIESSEGREKFYERILRYVRTRVADQTISNTENQIYIDTLLGGSQYMSTSTTSSFIDQCLEMVEEKKEEAVVVYGYNVLVSLSKNRFPARKVNNTLLKKIDFGNEPIEDIPPADKILNTILQRGKGKSGLTKPRADKLVANLESQSGNDLAANFIEKWKSIE